MKMKHFRLSEFDSPDEVGSGSKMNTLTLEMLDKARSIASTAFNITSGYRTLKHNKDVGGVTSSSHTVGKAVDIACTSSVNRLKIIESLLDVGFKRIGIAKTFIHVDNDETKPNYIWVY